MTLKQFHSPCTEIAETLPPVGLYLPCIFDCKLKLPTSPPLIKFTLLVAATDHITCGGSGREKKQQKHLVQLTERRSWFSRRKCYWTIKLSPFNRRRIKLTSIDFQLGLPPTQVLLWINSQKNNQPSSAGLSLPFSKGKALGTICWSIIVIS